jgi:hypothetical protein
MLPARSDRMPDLPATTEATAAVPPAAATPLAAAEARPVTGIRAAQDLQRMLSRHFDGDAGRAETGPLSLAVVIEMIVSRGSRLAGPVLLAAALFGLAALIW